MGEEKKDSVVRAAFSTLQSLRFNSTAKFETTAGCWKQSQESVCFRQLPLTELEMLQLKTSK